MDMNLSVDSRFCSGVVLLKVVLIYKFLMKRKPVRAHTFACKPNETGALYC